MGTVRTRSQEALDKAAEEAGQAEREKEQALAEEEIGHHLPREVLNLVKKFDLQQQSIDSFQGNLASLTEMVAQIGLAVN
jgi:hypothetical protein